MTQAVESLPPSSALLARLEDPQTVAQLLRLLDRVGEFNALFDLLESGLQRGPGIADNLGRLIRETRERVPGVSADLPRLVEHGQRLGRVLDTPDAQKLLTVLEDPATLRAAGQLVAKLPDLLLLSQMAESFLQRGPAISNNVGRLLREFRTAQQGQDGLGSLLGMIVKLDLAVVHRTLTSVAQLLGSSDLRHLLGSQVFGRDAVNMVGDLAVAATTAARRSQGQHLARPSLLGTWRGLVTLLRDPAVRRVLSFTLLFVQQLGVLLYQRHRENEHGEARPSGQPVPAQP